MKSANHIPTASISLLQKLLVDREVFREINSSISENLIKMELRRIIMNKEIFIKDFNSISGFNINTIINEFSENIRVESNNLKLRFDNLIESAEDGPIISAILEREKAYLELYHLILNKPIANKYTHMILNNQLDETKRSILELEDLMSTLVTENS